MTVKEDAKGKQSIRLYTLEDMKKYMNNTEKDKKEQQILKKLHKADLTFRHVFINVIIIILCVLCMISIVRYLMMDVRSPEDNEQLIMCAVMTVFFLLLGALNNFWGDKLFDRFLTWVNGRYERKNQRISAGIKDLNSALHQLSQSNGVVVWDTIWGSGVAFMAVMFIVFFERCNKPAVLGLLTFNVIMLIGGHLIGKKIWLSHRFEKRICKYTKNYLEIADEDAYVASVDASVRIGVLGFAGLWMLTDAYVIGRLSDISFEPVAIPRAAIVKYTFFFEKKIAAKGLPIGILQCRLNNGKCVNYTLGRGKACDQALSVLNEQKIVWEQEELRYS